MSDLFPDLDSIKKQVHSKKSLVEEFDWGEPMSTDRRHVNDFYDSGWVGFFNLDLIISDAIEAGASDVHITGGQEIYFTINGDTKSRPEYGVPNQEVVMDFGEGLLTNLQYSEFTKDRDYDFAYTVVRGPYSGRRLRGHIGRSLSQEYFTFRIISDKIPSIEELEVEREILEWFKVPDGLVLICGATGTGKSTTLASIIRDIQLREFKKIVTIEKPIEYVYPVDGNSLIVQREVGSDCVSFNDGLTAAMRDAPDIILIGEVRNNEEVSELIRAADQGHIAVSTMHTNSVSTTINRIQSLFSGDERIRILSTLSDSLKGLGNQVLVKDKKGGRFACREILTINEEIRDLILSGDVRGIRRYQTKHKSTMEYSLAKAAIKGRCTVKEARSRSSRPDEFDTAFKELMGE